MSVTSMTSQMKYLVLPILKFEIEVSGLILSVHLLKYHELVFTNHYDTLSNKALNTSWESTIDSMSLAFC